MGKTLEQTIHEMELPRPGAEGEDFNSYISRIAHAAAFVGAAWAIANGPQVQIPPKPSEPVKPPPPMDYTHPAEQDEPEGDWVHTPHQDNPDEIVKER